MLKNNTTLQVVVNHYNNDYTLTPGQTIKIAHPITSSGDFRIISPVSYRIKLEAEGFNYSVIDVDPETLHVLNLMPCTITLIDTLHSEINQSIGSNTTVNIQYYPQEQHNWKLVGAETDNTFNYITYQSERKYFLFDYDPDKLQLIIQDF
jgi:hypothetical protein